jgi:hypothetical protein
VNEETGPKAGAPDWRPECPWPESVWPMTAQQYVAAVPDPAQRTAISGFLMRRGWEVAVKQIEERLGGEAGCQQKETK